MKETIIEQRINDEIIVLEKICLLKALENKYKFFKKIKATNSEFLIAKN